MVRLIQFDHPQAVGNDLGFLIQHKEHADPCQQRLDMLRLHFHHTVQCIQSLFRLVCH